MITLENAIKSHDTLVLKHAKVYKIAASDMCRAKLGEAQEMIEDAERAIRARDVRTAMGHILKAGKLIERVRKRAEEMKRNGGQPMVKRRGSS